MKSWILSLLSILLLCACNGDDEADRRLVFMGDSMVANWDVEACFPNRITENMGIDGIGIAQLGSTPMEGQTVLALIGTNDLHGGMTEAQLSDYSEQYINTVAGLGGSPTLVISVLPTHDKAKNETIVRFNRKVKSLMSNKTEIIYIDCYEAFCKDGVLREELSRDGLHLNDYGYMILSDRVKEKL